MADTTSIRISLADPSSKDAYETSLDKHLSGLENFLRAFGFCQYSFLSTALSWLAFLITAVGLPLFAIQYSHCANCERYEIKIFEIEILVSQALVAAVSLLCISHNLRKYGVRKLLFVEWHLGYMAPLRQQYVQKIHVSNLDSHHLILFIVTIIILFFG